MLTSQQRDALAEALDGGKLQIRNSLLTWADATWRSLPDHRDTSVARFEQAAIPRVQSAAAKTAALTDAMLARAYDDGEGLVGTVDVKRLRPGVALEDEYRRPAITLYDELKGGSTYSAAVDAGAARLASLISMDLQLASTQQSAASTRGRRAARGGFRRYLTGRENCALCLIASTQRYHRGDLMPIHPGCDCGVKPLAPGENTGQVIDPERLEATQNWIGATQGTADRGARNLGFGKEITGSRGLTQADYTDLIVTRQHGEFGPTLTWRRHSFTGPDAL